MAKTDKEYYWRMQGMLYALKVGKEEGFEALEDDIRKRNITQIPISVGKNELEKIYTQLCDTVYANIIATMLYTLYDHFEFTKEELQEARREFAKNVEATMDLDYMGLHYVRMQDYAKELNEKFDLGINDEVIADCENSYDKKNERTRYCQIDHVLTALKRDGFEDAAKYLEEHLTY